MITLKIIKAISPVCDVKFDVDLNNVRQRRNNVLIFNVDFHNVGQRRYDAVNMTI